ncbi:TBC1 domain family member 13 [Ananas comosus]|uniref:TBC1 domain family member 13 n=1 Tax=Ananas comosus TaxID=4615 RepID=A0A199UVT0_ANACO|nr:TBC1 domain family member 13 [Ananas comosus]
MGAGKRTKLVPEWLNNPLWSSPPPSAAAVAAAQPAPALARYESPPRAPPPLPPPQTESSMPPPQPARGVKSEAAEEASPSGASRAEESIQSHLLAEFKLMLSKRVVNLGELRRLACQGVPDGAGIRQTVWKLLLGYLPTDRTLWAHELEKKRSQYGAFKDELLLNPSEITRRMEESEGFKTIELKSEGTGLLSRSEITHGEHPLSLGKTSVWNQYFQESEIVEQIDRDVKRTHPEMPFFSSDTSLAKSNQESLRRILIIFAKLNPGIRYVQGMNEVLAPLFYVFKNDPDQNNAAYAEADTFFCFVELLSGFRDNFCKQLDNSVVGIRSTISKLSQLLKRHDEELWRHLEVTTKVNPQFYAFRWITLLLTQEFNFADCLHIWDTLLGDPEGHFTTDLLRDADTRPQAPPGRRFHRQSQAPAKLPTN